MTRTYVSLDSDVVRQLTRIADALEKMTPEEQFKTMEQNVPKVIAVAKTALSTLMPPGRSAPYIDEAANPEAATLAYDAAAVDARKRKYRKAGLLRKKIAKSPKKPSK